MAIKISDKAWGDISETDYSSASDFCDACAIDLNPEGKEKTKALCKLPYKEPGGAINRNGVHAAAARFNQTDAPTEAKKKAARKLVEAYRALKEEPPGVLADAAGSEDKGKDMNDEEMTGYKVCFDTQMELKEEANNGTGMVSAYFAVFNIEDREKDIIVPGALDDTIPEILKDGVLLARHGRGNDQPIATIADIKTDNHGAKYFAEYHSTDFAQQERTIARERLSRGKSIGNSFGYRVPPKGAEYKSGGGRYLRKINVFEITTNTHMPAHPLAQTLSVKDLRLQDGRPLAEQKEAVLAAAALFEDFVTRLENLYELRTERKEGRRFSSASLGEMRQVHEAMMSAHGTMGDGMNRLKQLLDAAMPQDDSKDLHELALKEWARFEALRMGLT